MGADGKSAEIEANLLLTIEPDTDNAGVGNFHSALRYSLSFSVSVVRTFAAARSALVTEKI